MHLFLLYILALLSLYRNANDCAFREMQLYASQPIIHSANESLNVITSVLLFTVLLMARKLYSFLLQGTEEIWVIYIGTCRAFCALRHLMSYMHVSYLTVLSKNGLCTLSFVLEGCPILSNRFQWYSIALERTYRCVKTYYYSSQ